MCLFSLICTALAFGPRTRVFRNLYNVKVHWRLISFEFSRMSDSEALPLYPLSLRSGARRAMEAMDRSKKSREEVIEPSTLETLPGDESAAQPGDESAAKSGDESAAQSGDESAAQ